MTKDGNVRPAGRRRTRVRREEEPADLPARRIDPGPLDGYLGYYLRRLYDGYRRHFVARAGDLDVQPREVGALFIIGLNPGLTPTQLRGELGLDGAQITAMLNMFDGRGFLERRVSEADGRSRLVHLTPAGEQMLARVATFATSFDRDFIGGGLDDAELAQLIALLAKLYTAVGSGPP